MTNASKVSFSVLSSFAVAAVLVFGAFAGIANADDDANVGYLELGGSYIPDYVDTYVPDYTDSYVPDYSDSYYPDYSDTYLPDYTDTYLPDYTDTYLPDYTDTYLPDYVDTYLPDYVDSYFPEYTDKVFDSYGVGYSYSQSFAQQSCAYCYSQSTPSYSQPFRVSNPSFPSYPSYPSYPTPHPTPTPVPQPPRPTPPPPVYPPVTPTSNVTEICKNNSCNTTTNIKNIDNSINGSFNSTVLTPISQVATPFYPVQYIAPQQNTFCVITASPSTIQNGQAAFLSWSSNGATSAWLSDGIGYVAPNGSLSVRPNVSTNYTPTVSGFGGTRTCNVFVNVSGTYVSLSQIPYTGLDLGAFGSAIYFGSFLAFAGALAYLALYFKGGASVFASSLLGSVRLPKRAERVEALPLPSAFSNVARAEAPSFVAPVLEDLPVFAPAAALKDEMSIARDSNPRIVISRS